VRVGNATGIGHYPWFLHCRLGISQLGSADRSLLVPTATAFAGGDWYRSTVLGDAIEVCHAARGSQHGCPEGDHGERVQRAGDCCDVSDPADVRDYAILMLIAGLSLRSIEAARLQLGGLDWRAGRTILHGKAFREDGMALPADIMRR
jgi:hypothetical protein